ncbi:MAG: cyclic nucleotide-binding domain-containing protein, partial [Gemmatimonadaceae bacterium]
MHDQSLLTLLAEHRALGSAPATEHEWLAAHGIHRLCAVGDVLARKGEMAQSLLVIFSGNLTIRVSGPGSHKITGLRGGEVSGLLPFSRGTYAPNDVVVEEATELLDIGHPHFAELIRECPTVTGIL